MTGVTGKLSSVSCRLASLNSHLDSLESWMDRTKIYNSLTMSTIEVIRSIESVKVSLSIVESSEPSELRDSLIMSSVDKLSS